MGAKGDDGPPGKGEVFMTGAFVRPSRVLLVSASQAEAEHIERLLGLDNNSVDAVAAPGDALASLEEGKPDLILLGAALGNPVGFDFCRRLKQMPGLHYIPVVILLSGGDAGSQIEALFKKKNIKAATVEQYLEWVYFIRVGETDSCRIDTELRELGLASNRRLETLKALVAFLRDPQKQTVAPKLLGRYTTEDFQQPEEWEKWLRENDGRVFFTDVGGYKFMVVPKGCLEENR